MDNTEQHEYFLRRNRDRLLRTLAEGLQTAGVDETAAATGEDEGNDGSVFSNRFLLFFFFLWNVAVGAHFVPVLWMRLRRHEQYDCSMLVRILFAAPALSIGIAIPIIYGYSKQGVAGILIVFAITIFVPYLGWFMCMNSHGGDEFSENPLLACCFCCRPTHLYPPPIITNHPPTGSSSSPHNINAIMAIGNDSFHEPISNTTLYKKERELLILNTIIVCKVKSATETNSEKGKLPNELNAEEGVEISNGEEGNANLQSSAEDESLDPLEEVDITKDRLKDMKESSPTKATPDNNEIPNPPSNETDETSPSSDNEVVTVSNYQEKSDIILAPTTSDDPNSEDNVSAQQCYICLEEYQPGDEIAWSQNPGCCHAFHKDCLVGWLMSHDECPVCRNTYDYEEELRA